MQNCFTTKESEDEALDPALVFGDIAQTITAFGSSSSSILRVLCSLCGESSLAAVLCEPELEVTTHSKRQGTRIKALADDQRPVGCEKLTGQERYCVRQGSYRVVYKIEDDGLIVTVVKAAHRSEIHR